MRHETNPTATPEYSKFRNLILIGDYWEVLDLKPDATAIALTERVIMLRGDFPSLGKDWNHIQQLFSKRSGRRIYGIARTERDKTIGSMKKRFGPVALTLPITAGGRPQTCQRLLWARFRDLLSQSPETLKREQLTGIGRQLVRDMAGFLQSLPVLHITKDEAKEKQTERNLVTKSTCSRCNGTHRLKLSGRELVREAIVNKRLRRELRKTWGEGFYGIAVRVVSQGGLGIVVDDWRRQMGIDQIFDFPLDTASRQISEFVRDKFIADKLNREVLVQEELSRMSAEIACPDCVIAVTFEIPQGGPYQLDNA